ncbi:MAG: YlxR family protein [Clostridia bacterium]|nr:YlxR family protein [Clostridia bacterium]
MKEKKAPERMCIACKGMFPKRELIRIVRTAEGQYFVDKTGKTMGRGCYICDNPQCIAKCIKAKLLNKAYKTEIGSEVYIKLNDDYNSAKKN